MKKRIKIIFALCLVLSMIVVCYYYVSMGRAKDAVTVIADIAYNVNRHSGYTVFILEVGEYVPYLVLTNDYNGNTLLLRKYVLDELMRYGPPHDGIGRSYASYYGTSELGHFLNNEFFYLFSESLQEKIVNSTIEITARHSLAALADNDLITIGRRVFLLSYEETYGRQRRRFMEEGERLSYFSHGRRSRIALTSDGEAMGWWLRTPDTSGIPNEPGAISFHGVHSTLSIQTLPNGTTLGVRPAFCLPGDTPIRQGELGGETVFFINEG